jgi:hypothetical protein
MSSPYPFGNDPSKINGYKKVLDTGRGKTPVSRVFDQKLVPLEEFEASRAWQSRKILTPEMIDPAAFMDDQEWLLREGKK